MVLNAVCPPALIYLIFSVTQISIDTFQGQYNTAFAKIWVAVVFTVVLNYLCRRGLGIISWFIVFIPFMLMTLIISILLYVFGLDPATGRLKIYAPPKEFKQDMIDYRQGMMPTGTVPAVPMTPPLYNNYYNQRESGRTNEYARGSDYDRDRNNSGYPSGLVPAAPAAPSIPVVPATPATPATPAPPATQNIGGQADAHGCLTGAGYSWCAPLNKCIGPGDTCPQSIGGQADAHGCLTGAGYAWCDALGKCVGPGHPCLDDKKIEAFSWPPLKWPTLKMPSWNISAPLIKLPAMSVAADLGSMQFPIPTATSLGCAGGCTS